MSYTQPQPPDVNGVMVLSDADAATITGKLQAIQAAFVASTTNPVCDTFYLTATYNQQNAAAPINGDTCEALLAPPSA